MGGLNDKSIQSVCTSIRSDQVIASVDYYVDKSGIKYKATADNYFSALSVFFDYINSEYTWRAGLFIDSGMKNKLRQQYAEEIKKLKLFSKEQSQPLSEEEYERLLLQCNDRINNVEADDLLKQEGYNSTYTYFVSALATKIVLYTGVKNNILAELPCKAYDEVHNKILINGYSVHLPDELARQMRKYYREVRMQIVQPNENVDALFINRKTEKRNLGNATLFCILQDIIGTKKVAMVAKYRILQMIGQNIPTDIIKQFTGYSDEVVGHCQEMYDENNGGTDMLAKIRKLDSGLRAIENYDVL